MYLLLSLFLIICFTKIQYILCDSDFRCDRNTRACTLFVTPNDVAFTNVILRCIQPLESLDLEFDVYGWQKNPRAIDRANAKINRYVSRDEFMRICKHLNILDKCSASRGLSIIVAAQLASANRMRDPGAMQQRVNSPMGMGNQQMMRGGGGGMSGMNQIGGTHSNPGYNSMGGSPMGNRMGGGFGGGMNPGGGHGNTFRVGSGYNPNMRDNVIPFSAAHGGNNFGGFRG
ncbi:Hypothetical protein SRAE_2000451400 [Strongyloides ratti]|uniref:Uncharacterized protein n=1 Tax=Strongyloides ratti TaxID=34506 RepID=A0A090LJI3_STRRB|nr:Hypothetical protein SRAE_2000451400 [Strongyloides ratti]CEF69868.1 Hypothetical protein SRAE_2000451400 [Strongyloides ratti]